MCKKNKNTFLSNGLYFLENKKLKKNLNFYDKNKKILTKEGKVCEANCN